MAKVVAVVAAAGLGQFQLILLIGNKGNTKPHDASNTREQFESSVGTGCLWQLASQSPQRQRVIAAGGRGGGAASKRRKS